MKMLTRLFVSCVLALSLSFALNTSALANYAYVKNGLNSANSATITFSPTNTGDLLVLWSRTSAGGGTPTITSVVDNNSVSWTIGLASAAYGSGSANWVTMVYLPNCESGITSVTVTYNGGAPGALNLLIAEYSGIATTSPLIGVTSGNAQAAPGTTANAITSTGLSVASGVPAMIMGLVCVGGDGDTVAGTGYTGRLLSNSTWLFEDLRATTTGTQTATATAATHGGTDSYITFTAAFKEAGGGSTPSSQGFWIGN